MPKEHPLVFLGSSTEGLQIAKAVQAELQYSAECVIWSQGVFGLSTGTLETLVEKLQIFDFAVLVLSPDDLVSSRGDTQPAPRDNVLLELGMFIGALGRNRTFIVIDRSTNVKLPSDLAGITPATYESPVGGTMRSAVGPACTDIDEVIRKLGRKKEDSVTVSLKRSDVVWKSFNKQVTSRFWACGTSLAPLCDRKLIPQFIDQGVRDIRILLPDTTEKPHSCSRSQLCEFNRVGHLGRDQVRDADDCYSKIESIITDLLSKNVLDGDLHDHLRRYCGTMYANLTISDKEAYAAYYGMTGSGDEAVTLHILAGKKSEASQWVEGEFSKMWDAPQSWGVEK